MIKKIFLLTFISSSFFVNATENSIVENDKQFVISNAIEFRKKMTVEPELPVHITSEDLQEDIRKDVIKLIKKNNKIDIKSFKTKIVI